MYKLQFVLLELNKFNFLFLTIMGNHEDCTFIHFSPPKYVFAGLLSAMWTDSPWMTFHELSVCHQWYVCSMWTVQLSFFLSNKHTYRHHRNRCKIRIFTDFCVKKVREFNDYFQKRVYKTSIINLAAINDLRKSCEIIRLFRIEYLIRLGCCCSHKLKLINENHRNSAQIRKFPFKMNSLGWAILFKMGCLCSKETVVISGTKYVIRERIAQG